MSVTFSSPETRPRRDRSLPQLLHIAHKKLRDIICNQNNATTMSQSEADSLERDAFEVIRLVRFIRNTLAPINRVPPEVLSLIPDYYGEEDKDQMTIALTHVCQSWRDMFTSRPPLWTRFRCTDVDKSLTYLQRSKSSPLELQFRSRGYMDSLFAPVIPHIHRLKSLTFSDLHLPSALKSLRFHIPLLEKLDLEVFTTTDDSALNNTLFDGDLSSLRELRLHGPLMHLPPIANLRVANLETSFLRMTQILDFLESAPFLHTISLTHSTLNSSDAPPARVIHLRHLKDLTIHVPPPHSTLLHHLHIPTGASLTISEVHYRGEELESLLQDYLPTPARSPNADNLSHLTAINLHLHPSRKHVRLSGSSGRLVLVVAHHWSSISYALDYKILRSLTHSMLSRIQTLTISTFSYEHPDEESPIVQTLSSANSLRTLILIDCYELPFILALGQPSPSNLLPCSNLERLVLYFRHLSPGDVGYLMTMAKNRASMGAKLQSIAVFHLRGHGIGREVSTLGEHVTHVEYRVISELPAWNEVPGGNE